MRKSKSINQNFKLTKAICFFIVIITTSKSSAQSNYDSILNKLDPQKWAVTVEKKVSRLEEKIIAKSEKTLRKLQKEEEKIYKKLLLFIVTRCYLQKSKDNVVEQGLDQSI